MSEGKVRVGVYAACVRDGRLLLVHQISDGPAKDRWHLPGGGLDYGEALAEGVRREVREEAGCDVEVGQVIAAADNVYLAPDGIERHGIRLVFAAEVIGEPTSPNNDEIDQVAWFPLDDLPAGSTVTAGLAAEIVRGVGPTGGVSTSSTDGVSTGGVSTSGVSTSSTDGLARPTD